MQITYEDDSVKELFEDLCQIQMYKGLGKPHSLTGMEGCYGVHVTANWRLVICPVAEDTSPEALKQCDTVQIKGVVDYHGKGSKNNWLIP